jgi:hypothetical protein
VEFLLAADGTFSFLEMNTRLQVEHPVTEMVTGTDLVALQIAIAEGRCIPADLLVEVPLRGHAIEVRLCAEDPHRGHLPVSGRFHEVVFPPVPGVRVDSAIESGSEVPPHYDSMIAKLIAHGSDRAEAARRLVKALAGATLHGPITNRELLLDPSAADRTRARRGIDTGWLDATTSAAPAPYRCSAVGRRRHPQGRFPIGWRNNPSQLHRQAVVLGEREHMVQYRFDRADVLQELVVDGDVEVDGFCATNSPARGPPCTRHRLRQRGRFALRPATVRVAR